MLRLWKDSRHNRFLLFLPLYGDQEIALGLTRLFFPQDRVDTTLPIVKEIFLVRIIHTATPIT